MSEEEQGTQGTDSGSVSEQETPDIKETPSATEVPEGQKQVEETPAESNSETESAVAPPEKDLEALQADRAHFQAESQKAKEELASFKAQEQPAVQKTETDTTDDKQSDEFSNLSQEDIDEKLRESPMLMARVVTEELDRRAIQRDSDRDQKSELATERTNTVRVLNEFCSKNKVTKEEYDAVSSDIQKMGIQAPPHAFGQLVINALNQKMMEGSLQRNATEAGAKAAQAAKTQALTTGPESGVATPTSEPLTQAQIIQKKFEPSKTKSPISNIWN